MEPTASMTSITAVVRERVDAYSGISCLEEGGVGIGFKVLECKGRLSIVVGYSTTIEYL